MVEYVRDPKGEKGFEVNFGYRAPTFGCYYDKMKDPKITQSKYLNLRQRQILAKARRVKGEKVRLIGEVRRSYDGTLFTRLGNFPVECKYNDGTLLPHQKKAQEAIDAINNSFFIVRKVVQYQDRSIITKYWIQKRIDKRVRTIFRTYKFEDIYGWFNGIVGEGSEHVSYFVSWLKKEDNN